MLGLAAQNETHVSWVIAADAETQLQPAFMANARASAVTYVRAWERQRMVVSSNISGPFYGQQILQNNTQAKQNKMDLACKALGLESVDGYPWWADAPVYSRHDYDDFIRLLRVRHDFMDPAYHGALPYDHLVYLCFKIRVGGWSVRYIDYPSATTDLTQGFATRTPSTA